MVTLFHIIRNTPASIHRLRQVFGFAWKLFLFARSIDGQWLLLDHGNFSIGRAIWIRFSWVQGISFDLGVGGRSFILVENHSWSLKLAWIPFFFDFKCLKLPLPPRFRFSYILKLILVVLVGSLSLHVRSYLNFILINNWFPLISLFGLSK
jgi:hypothetical protein